MELKQLEYFVMAADLGSLSKAAEILYTTQPNVSRVVNSLEKELNIKLLDRNSKGVVISKEGGRLYGYAKEILKNSEMMKAIANQKNNKELKISSYPSNQISTIFCNYYESVKDTDIKLEFLEGTVEEITDNVQKQISDIGMIYISKNQKNKFKHILHHKRLEYIELASVGVTLYVGKNNPFYNLERISINDLKDTKIIQASKDQFSMEHNLEEIGVRPSCMEMFDSIINTNSNHVMINLLLKTEVCNIGIDFLNAGFKQYDIKSVKIEECGKCFSFGYVKRKNEMLSKESIDFLDLIERSMDTECECVI